MANPGATSERSPGPRLLRPTRSRDPFAKGSLRRADRPAPGSWLLAASQAGRISNLRFGNDQPRETYRFEVYRSSAVDRLLEHLDQPCVDWKTETLRRLLLELRRSRRCLHSYCPEFSYDDDRGVHHIEGVKGRISERYRLNRILMESCFEIEIEEPSSAAPTTRPG